MHTYKYAMYVDAENNFEYYSMTHLHDIDYLANLFLHFRQYNTTLTCNPYKK